MIFTNVYLEDETIFIEVPSQAGDPTHKPAQDPGTHQYPPYLGQGCSVDGHPEVSI